MLKWPEKCILKHKILLIQPILIRLSQILFFAFPSFVAALHFFVGVCVIHPNEVEAIFFSILSNTLSRICKYLQFTVMWFDILTYSNAKIYFLEFWNVGHWLSSFPSRLSNIKVISEPLPASPSP